jgi:hypothetical protein
MRKPPVQALVLALTLASPMAAIAQIPDSVATIRRDIGCPSLEGTWSITLVLDSSGTPRYPSGRSTSGEVTLGGNKSFVAFNPDYPCRTSGRFSVDQRPLWGSKLHPTATDAHYPDAILDEAYSEWMGGRGKEDSVMVDLATMEPGGLSLRGRVRSDTITGTWYLLTCDVCSGPFADGHFVMTRRAQ